MLPSSLVTVLLPNYDARLRRFLLGLPGLLCLYPGDDAPGSATIKDIGPNGFHLTVDGATLGKQGRFRRPAPSCDGVNDKFGSADVVDNATLQVSTVTLFGMFKNSDVTRVADAIISYGNAGGVASNGYQLYIHLSKVRLDKIVATVTVSADSDAVVNDRWQMAAGTFDGAQTVAWKDGVAGTPVATITAPGWLATEELVVGAVRDSAVYSHFQLGSLAYVGMCSGALPDATLKQMARLMRVPV